MLSAPRAAVPRGPAAAVPERAVPGHAGLVAEGAIEAAGARHDDAARIDGARLARWLAGPRDVQGDDRMIVRRRGRPERL